MQAIIEFFVQKRISVFILTALLVLTISYGNAQDRHPLVIVTFGNSTTAPRETINKVYAVRLHEILTTAGIDNKVINSGRGGSHSGSFKDNINDKNAHGMDRLDTAVLRYNPDWVTINFGINDSWQNAGKKGVSRIPIDKYRQNLSFFIDRIRGEGGKVILLTPNPLGKKYKGFHHRRLKKYMRVTRDLAKVKKLPFIDTWKLFDNYEHKMNEGIDTLLLDGMHPNDTGHMLIANQIAKIIFSSSKLK